MKGFKTPFLKPSTASSVVHAGPSNPAPASLVSVQPSGGAAIVDSQSAISVSLSSLMIHARHADRSSKGSVEARPGGLKEVSDRSPVWW